MLTSLVAAVVLAGVAFAMFGTKIMGQKMAAASAAPPSNSLVEQRPTGSSPVLNAAGTAPAASSLAQGGSSPDVTSLVEEATGATPPTLAAAPEQQPPSTLAATPAPPTPTLPAPGSAGMPDDVRAWLEHLQRCEARRVALASAQLQEAVTTFAKLQGGDMIHALGDDGEEDSEAAEHKRTDERRNRVAGGMKSMRELWQTLLSDFDSKQPPAECVAIKGNYDKVVTQTGLMILEIVDTMQSAAQNPQGALAALTAMQGKSTGRIDVPAQATDKGVAQVCERYNTIKWFSVSGDVGSGVRSQLGF